VSVVAYRPQLRRIDAWGLTHPGLVRQVNQDHFFVGSLVRGIEVGTTSVEATDTTIGHLQRLATLGIVADGVGSTAGGGEAARLAVSGLLESVSRFFHDVDRSGSDDPERFSRLLIDAALACHEHLLARAVEESGKRRFATTLTVFLGLWPQAYLLQVGDSRCYVFHQGVLNQISRDQTVAQALVDSGALSRTVAEGTQWAHVLASAIGGPEAAPVVTRVVRELGTVVLLCSDGLTKHVPDDRIAARLSAMTSARQVAEQLLQDALDGGGTDNISIVVGRTLAEDEALDTD
jgi:serine/threonine protein phosphatase PrpC